MKRFFASFATLPIMSIAAPEFKGLVFVGPAAAPTAIKIPVFYDGGAARYRAFTPLATQR